MKKRFSILFFLLLVIPACNFLAPPTPTPIPTSTPIPTPTLGIGSSMTGKDGMTLLYVPAGEFTMGSNANIDEKPMHQVYLDAFWIDQTEVTNKQYIACVDAGKCVPPTPSESYWRFDQYYGVSEFDDYPIIFVNWYSAKTYCEWVGRRLPTEAEWEKAARGTNANLYPWGDETASEHYVNFDSSGITEVGSFPDGMSVYGMLDMAGNVIEWVSSLYKPYPYYPNDGREDLESSGLRVVRGGSWDDFPHYITSAIRNRYDPATSTYDLGFRCAVSQ